MGEFMISLVLFGLFGVRQSMMRCAAPFVMTLVLDDPSTSSGDKQTCEQITGSHCRSHCLYARDRNRSVEVLQARDVVLVNVHCGEAETLGCVEAGLRLGGGGGMGEVLGFDNALLAVGRRNFFLGAGVLD